MASGNIDHEENLADEDSDKDKEVEASMLQHLNLKLLTRDGRHWITMKVHLDATYDQAKISANAMSTAYDMVASYTPLSLWS